MGSSVKCVHLLQTIQTGGGDSNQTKETSSLGSLFPRPLTIWWPMPSLSHPEGGGRGQGGGGRRDRQKYRLLACVQALSAFVYPDAPRAWSPGVEPPGGRMDEAGVGPHTFFLLPRGIWTKPGAEPSRSPGSPESCSRQWH